VLVSGESAPAANNLNLPARFEVKWDKGGKVAKLLNGVEPPRLYTVSRDSRLLAFQKPAQSPYDFASTETPNETGL
jgi:hypothetical protein